MKLTLRLALVFLLYAAVLLAIVGILSYSSGRGSLRTAAISELLATAIEKQAALNEWVDKKQSVVGLLASDPGVISNTETLIAAKPGSPEHQAAHTRLVEEFKPHLGIDFFSLFVMDPDTGRVIAAVDPGEEGKIQKDRPFFVNGRTRPYVENLYYSANLQNPAMTAAAPLRGPDGQVLAVLAGRLNLEEMNAIFNRRSGLRQSDDTFLVNSDNLLVTQPRFLSDPAVLQRGIHTEAVERCLGGNSGVTEGADYNNTPSIVVYRWLPDRSLCLIAKMEQAEAYAPARAFGSTVILISVLALGTAGLSAIVLSRELTRPILALKTGAEIFGRGDLDYRIPSLPRNEIGLLGASFNEMAASLKRSLGRTAHGQQMMVALSQAAVAVQRARSANEVYATVGQVVSQLGFQVAILTLTADKKSLATAYVNTDHKLLQAVERLVGFPVKSFQLDLESGSTFHKVIDSGEPVFLDPFVDVVKELLPAPARPLANKVVEMMGIQQSLVVPLGPARSASGILTVSGKGLAETDLPAISTFANQITTALENNHLFEQIQAWAHELEARVERRTAELKVSEEKFRGAFEHAAIGRAMATPQGKFLQTNQAFCDILGYSMEEVLARQWMDVTHPDHVPIVGAQIEKLLKGDKPSFQLEIKLLPREGEDRLVWVNLNVVLSRDSQGQPLYMIGDIVNVTERKRVEDALWESSQLLERMFSSVDFLVAYMDTQFNFIRVNRAYAQVDGQSPDYFIGKNHFDLYQDEENEAIFRRVVETGEIFSAQAKPFVNPRRPKQGVSYWNWTLQPVKNSAGEVMGLVFSLVDVTERELAEQALRESEEHYRLLFNQIHYGFALHEIICDEAGQPVDYRYLEVNPAFEELTGLQSGELIGRTVLEVLPKTEAYWIETFGRVAITGEPVRFNDYSQELRKYYEVSAYCPKPGQFAVTFMDVTERELALDALRESEDKFKYVFEYSLVGKSITSPSGELNVNKAYCEMLGYSEEELKNKKWQDITHPDDIELSNRALAPLFSGERESARFIKRYLHKNGSIVWADLNTSVRRNREGKPAYFITVILDITDRILAEDTLRKSEERYRSLFENMLSGYAHCQMLFDENDKPFDFVYIDVNPVFEKMTGLRNVEGKNVNEVIPGIQESNPELFEIYGRVAVTGQPEKIETHIESLGIWLSISVYSPKQGYFVAMFENITDRKQAEEALRLENERFMRFFDSNIVGIVIADASGKIIMANDYYLNLLGVKRQDFLAGKVDWRKFTPPEWLPADEKALKQLSETGVCEPYEKEYIRADGVRVPVYLADAMLPGPEEQIAAFVLDITERKQAEQALRESEERYRGVYDTVPVSLWREDWSGVIAAIRSLRMEGVRDFGQYFADHPDFVNQALDQVIILDVNDETLGIFKAQAKEEMLASLGTVFSTEDTLPGFVGELVALGEGRRIYRTEMALRTVQNDLIHVLLTMTFPLDESISGEVLVSVMDITESKRTELALADSLGQLKRAEQTGQLGSWSWDIQEDRVTWSDGLYQLFGLAPQEFGATYSAYLERIHPEDVEFVQQSIGSALQQRSPLEYERRIVRSDGQVRHLMTRAEVLLDESGQPHRMIGVAVDTTERVQAEEALQRTAEELRRSNAELEQFAYVASHDLQEPLRMVSSYVQLLGKRYQGKLDQDADEFIAYAVDGAKRMQNLINDLLSYSRVGKRGNPYEEVSSENLLWETLVNLQFAIEECDAEVSHDPLPVVKGDPIQLGMVFQNLLGNAIKFRGPEKPRIHVSAHREEDEWIFSVCDNGIGIDPKFTERIFIIFQRLNERAAHPGTGIGLAICKRIISRHGGRIWVESQPGKGATFYFTIPIQESL